MGGNYGIWKWIDFVWFEIVELKFGARMWSWFAGSDGGYRLDGHHNTLLYNIPLCMPMTSDN